MPQTKQTASYLDLIEASNTFSPKDALGQDLYQLLLPDDTRPHGLMLSWVVEKMPWTSKFKIDHAAKQVQVMDISKGQNTSSAVDDAFSEVINDSIRLDVFSILRKQRKEWRAIIGTKYPVRILRRAQPLFGTIGQGVHLTAYTQTCNGLKLWISRRSTTIDTYPGMLDNTAAGSVPAGKSPIEAMIAEAAEEASLPKELVRRNVRAVGALTYVHLLDKHRDDEAGLINPEVIYAYDLELSGDVMPATNDDEVQDFSLMSVGETNQRLLNREFKPNCALVIIDFFIRHGILTADNEPTYLDINMRLHRNMLFDTTAQI